MNEMNPLETQLRSWKPRRPSARLERLLFARPAPVRSLTANRVPMPWLAPAMACLVLATLALNPRGSSLPGGQPLLGVILSNQSYAAYLPGSFQPEQNRWDTFEWTNHGQSGSSVAPFSPGRAQD